MKVVGGIALGLGILVAIALLVVSCLPFGAWDHVFFDLLSGLRHHCFLVAVLLTVVFGVLCIRRRKPLRAAALVLVLPSLLINGAAVLPLYFRPEPPELGPHPASCRLLCFNVQQKNREFEAVLRFVREENPDVAIFLETKHQWPARLRILKESHPHHLSYPSQHFEIFSRHPIKAQRLRPVGSLRGDSVFTLANGLTVVASHAYANVAVHDRGFEFRNRQLLDGIGRDLANDPRPLVVIGDLNVSPWSPYFQECLARSGLRDARRGFGPLPTQSRYGMHRLLGIPIDHCLTSPGIRVDSLRTGPDLGSDHLPLIADLSFQVPAFAIAAPKPPR